MEIDQKQIDSIVELCKIARQQVAEGKSMTVQEALERLKENRKKMIDTK